MKKILLLASVLTALNLNAQIFNNSFENWSTDTAYFSGFNFFPADTFEYSDPDQWTTTNPLSGTDTFGALFMVTQETTNVHTGNSAIRLTTADFDTVGTPLGPRKLTIPGLALNGVFPLDIPSDVLLLGGTISPVLIPGAGQPWSQRLAAIKGFYHYTPVFNNITGANDTLMIWATLKKGEEIVANAIFKSNAATSAYTAFSASFDYVSCSEPDTLVVLLASSVPNLGSLLLGTTDLVPGSVLLVDDLDYDTLAAGYAYPPIARNDSTGTFVNTPKTIAVKANDTDCDNLSLAGVTTAVATAPANGTAVVASGDITYTPNNNFNGLDSFTYTLNDGANTSAPAWVRVMVEVGSGINNVNQIPVTVFPVPASDVVNIQFENNGSTTLRVFDVTGKLMLTSVLTKNNNAISVAELANGIYNVQLSDNNNAILARTKFTVTK